MVRRVHVALDGLVSGAANLDVKAMVGHPGWLRLRVADWRVLYPPLNDDETAQWGAGYLIGRVVHRRDLERAGRTL